MNVIGPPLLLDHVLLEPDIMSRQIADRFHVADSTWHVIYNAVNESLNPGAVDRIPTRDLFYFAARLATRHRENWTAYCNVMC